jgi:hypothetical protein
MPDPTPAAVRRPPRPVGAADPAARRMTPISAADAESEAERLAFDEEPLPPITDAERKAAADAAPRPQITLSTTVLHRGRLITIQAADMTADQFCDILDRRGYAVPELSAQPAAPVATPDDLPDGWKLCKKHGAPMRPRDKQGDTWHSHNVGSRENPVYCKGYKGADSPGYDL